MSQLWVKKISPEIKDELNRRKEYLSYGFSQDLEVHDLEYQQWNAKTPWITVFSNVIERTSNSSTDLVEVTGSEGKTILWRDKESDYDADLAGGSTFRGLLAMGTKDRESFDEIYKSDSSDPFKLRPVPTLEGLSVENIDNYGAVRKATIKFTCYTLQQLEDMEKLYMSPGASIIIQWGWNIIDSQIMEVKFENKKDLKDYEKIKKKISDSGGNYGALVGTITKFNWEIGDDGSIGCSTEVVSRGYVELFENIKENTKVLFDDEDDKTIVDVLEGISNNEYKGKGVEIGNEIGGTDAYNSPYEIANKLKTLFHDERKGEATRYKSKTYLSIKFIVNLINLFYPDSAGKIFKNIIIEKSDEDNKDYEVPVLIGNYVDQPVLRSMDRDIFMIPKTEMKKLYLQNPENYWGVKWWFAPNKNYNGTAEPIDSILVNLEVVKSSFENALTYKDAVKNILAQLTQFSNGFWELDIENDASGFVRMVDRNYDPSELGKGDNGNITDIAYVFPSFGQYSMAQSVNVSATLPDQMKNAAAYSGVGGKNSKIKTGFGNLYGNIRDSFNKNFGGVTVYPKAPQTDVSNKSFEDAEKKTNKGSYTTKVSIDSKYWTYLASKWGLSKDGSSGYSSPSLIPLDLSLTIDGIEGLQYGNTISIDYLPERYKKHSAFIITSIAHDISQDGWTTTLGTQFRVASIKNMSQIDQWTDQSTGVR